ncbi:MAG: type II secretion system F family protein [Rhizobiaceae bacterium]|jgi:tight adherence protein B|nr:type II secretion system F family protein [Rhizobiaceae bacterium]
MFGIDMNVLVIAALIGVSALSVAYALLFNRVETERKQEKRLKGIKNNSGDRQSRLQAEARLADTAKRRQNVQNQLKELEEQTKAKDPNKKGIKEQLRQAGMSVSVRQFYLFSVLFAVFAGFMALILSGSIFVAGAMLVIGGIGMPRWFVGFRKKRRMKAFLEEFPNAVDVITRGIKAGLPLNDCIGIIATEAKEPVRSEFKKIIETQQMGVPMTEAIQKLYKNVPLTEANFFGIVIAIQQGAGGNLSEALANLSKVLRDRKKMKAKITAMSSEAKSSAAIIGCLPFIVTFLIYITTPDYIMLLFTHSTGNLILLGSAVWMSCGIMVMRQMINFDF